MLRGGGDSAPGVAPRELDFPYYNLADGFESTLLLVSDSPNAMHFTLAVRSSHGGLMLSTAESIASQQKLSIDLRSVVLQLGGDPNGAYAQGSVALYFMGTIMPIVGQISIRNPQLSLSHESEMVENDPGRSDVHPVLDGEWWALGGGVEAEVMVSNTSDAPQIAQVYLDFGGKRHSLPKPLTFLPYETKTLDITQLVESLGVDPAGAPAGGITIEQIGPNPALIANGKITDPATGFSSTIDFPLPQNERASALHATGLPIGTPSKDSPFAGTGTYTPRVIVRNLLATPQSVTITVEYPEPPAATPANPSTPNTPAPSVGAPLAAPSAKPRLIIRRPPLPGDKNLHPEWGAGLGATTRSLNVMTLPVAGYSTTDYSLASVMLQLPLPLPFCSIRIQYSGPPGSMEAEVSSVESTTQMVVDARVENEGNGWAGSGANPWHLDKNTESILFLTNEGAKTARIGFSITANGVHYYLTELRLQPHETRAISIRALRDAQVADFKENKIPAGAADGSVNWIRIDDVPVMGRLMVITRKGKMDSSYDCCTCPCPNSFVGVQVANNFGAGFTCLPGSAAMFGATAVYEDCNGQQYFSDITDVATWTTTDSSVLTVESAGAPSPGLATAVGPGAATLSAFYWDYSYTAVGGSSCSSSLVQENGYCPFQVDSLSFSITSGGISTDSQGVVSRQQFGLQIQARAPGGGLDNRFSSQGVPFTLENENSSVGETAPSSVSFSSGSATASVTIVQASGLTNSSRTITVNNSAASSFQPYAYMNVVATDEGLVGHPTACPGYTIPPNAQMVALPYGQALCGQPVLVANGTAQQQVPVEDVGPWCPHSSATQGNPCVCSADDYWLGTGVPYASTHSCSSNGAGIDLGDGTYSAVRHGSNGPINWKFP